jgi:hypothetical protein
LNNNLETKKIIHCISEDYVALDWGFVLWLEFYFSVSTGSIVTATALPVQVGLVPEKYDALYLRHGRMPKNKESFPPFRRTSAKHPIQFLVPSISYEFTTVAKFGTRHLPSTLGRVASL